MNCLSLLSIMYFISHSDNSMIIIIDEKIFYDLYMCVCVYVYMFYINLYILIKKYKI